MWIFWPLTFALFGTMVGLATRAEKKKEDARAALDQRKLELEAKQLDFDSEELEVRRAQLAKTKAAGSNGEETTPAV